MIRLAQILWAAALLTVLAMRSEAQDRPPIIDMHMHAFTMAWSGGRLLPNPVTGVPSAATTDSALLHEALAEMDRHNIVRAVTSGMQLDDVLRWRDADPSRIVAGPYLGGAPAMMDSSFATGRLRSLYQSGELGVMGEIGAQYDGVALNDSVFEPYWALAEEMDIPVGVHTGLGPSGAPYRCCPDFRAKLGDPIALEDVLVRHPKLRLYIMHAGGPYLESTKAILHTYPQVYADLAVINWIIPREEFHESLRALIRAGFGKRLMFGSDQMVWPEAIGMAVEGIESATFLTETEKRDILYNNAARFLRLSDEEIAAHHKE